jgi:hypothetical protein
VRTSSLGLAAVGDVLLVFFLIGVKRAQISLEFLFEVAKSSVHGPEASISLFLALQRFEKIDFLILERNQDQPDGIVDQRIGVQLRVPLQHRKCSACAWNSE